MPCEECENVVERTDVPHVIRLCSACGREMHIFEPGEHGRGFQVRPGDRVTIPAGWLKLSINPLQSTGHFTKLGLEGFAAGLFLGGIVREREKFEAALAELEGQTDKIVNSFPPLNGLDVNNPADSEQINTIMEEHRSTMEFWAYWVGNFLAMTRDAWNEGDHNRAAWAVACAERCRSMMIFKDALEEVVWMGHSAKRIIDIVRTWDAQKTNSAEEFWQQTFNENAYVLSQVFAVPMIFIKDKAYVGGTKLDRSDARFVDYLFSAESSREAVLIEIKTPTTPLLASEYRGNRPPSRELSGSVVQILNYRDELSRNLSALTVGTSYEIRAFRPRCAIIIGNAATELLDDTARRSFELFRRVLNDVEIITYDELFRKVEILAELFALKRSQAMDG
jgi:hypothetical protein